MAKKQAPAAEPGDDNVESSAPAESKKAGLFKAAATAFKSAFKKEDIRMGLMAFAGFGSFLATITGNARIKAGAAFVQTLAMNDEVFNQIWAIATGENA